VAQTPVPHAAGTKITDSSYVDSFENQTGHNFLGARCLGPQLLRRLRNLVLSFCWVSGCSACWLIFTFSGRGVGFMYYLDLSTESIYWQAVPFLVQCVVGCASICRYCLHWIYMGQFMVFCSYIIYFFAEISIIIITNLMLLFLCFFVMARCFSIPYILICLYRCS